LPEFAKPYVPPTRDTPLRFRYTDYMGETHPAANKVVLQFCTADLPLQPAHRLKLVKLLGPRYNPQADLAHLSCEMFATQAQNKRYLGDLVDTLMAEARGDNDAPDSADPFADVPVDFRHVKWKARARFPDAWKVTATRRAELEAQWAGEEHTESERVADGAVVDGVRLIQAAARSFPAVDHVPVAVEVGRRRDRTTPRMR
jgi:small subunit ribosomal protein S35